MAVYDVGVVGLGFVGLTIATALAEAGLRVLGVERRADVVDMTNRGLPHFYEKNLESALNSCVQSGNLKAKQQFDTEEYCDIYIITVGTPLDSHGQARIDFIEHAAREVAISMQEGALILMRSTVKIGTTRNVVIPILESTGKSFEIAVTPERTLEGNAMQELCFLPQIIGADLRHVSERAGRLFLKLTDSIVYSSTLEAAELTKLIDNSFRDITFGYANEVARICDTYGLNALEIISNGKLGYSRTDVAMPGLVGGPCLEKDPHILIESMRDQGIELPITMAARQINEQQPVEAVDFIISEHRRRSSNSPVIALMGMAFKGFPETDDLRGSMSLRVLEIFQHSMPEAMFRLYDPMCTLEKLSEKVGSGVLVVSSVTEALQDAHIAIILNNHKYFSSISMNEIFKDMADNGFIYDFWNHFSNIKITEHHKNYFALGNIGKQ